PIGCAVDFVCRLLHLKIISLKKPLQIGLCNKAGAYYTGNPKVELTQYNLAPVTGNPTSAQDAVDKEANEIRNDNKYEWMPVGKVGVNFYW
ncbi:hypothetical protein ACG9Y2_01115, partial [Acinetobacter baumannii]